MECECGLIVDSEEKYCPNCGRSIQNQITGIQNETNLQEIADLYDIPLKQVLMIEDISFTDQIKNNCIIYKDGIIDSFNDPDELLKVLEDDESLSESHENIAYIIFYGKKVEFSVVNKVFIFKPENVIIPIESYIDPPTINSSDYLVVLNDTGESVAKFESIQKMAEWIDTTGGEDVDLIFIKKEYHEWEIRPYFKIWDKAIEIKPCTPF